MKRFHVNLIVSDLPGSIRFYSGLFDQPPTLQRDDYAKWMLEDPRVNLSLSTHGSRPGVDHLGVQAETDDELAELRNRLVRAEAPVADQPDVTCCYARSTKAWTRDPDGVAWETFLSRGESAVYGDGTPTSATAVSAAADSGGACCDRPS